jgi:predicted RNA-binding Zn-ribbon protein involved in translation (DUF1610 family)
VTTHRIKRTVHFECDDCGEDFDSETDEFAEAWRKAKSEGWRAFDADERGWKHYCPDCEALA